jgi:hypothetical protein
MKYTYDEERYGGISWTSLTLDERNDFLQKSYDSVRSLHPEEFVPDYPMSKEELREKLIEDFSSKRGMPVEEYTLWLKWNEIQSKYKWVKPTVMQKILEIRDNVWVPKSIEDIENLEVEIIPTYGSKQMTFVYTTLCTFTTSMPNNQNVGRNLMFVVVDKNTQKYLGVMCASSDFLDLTCRDEQIGWDRDQRALDHLINRTYIGSRIVPTQPLGYNFTGGKLIALLLTSDVVQKMWYERYGDLPAGCTTTSLWDKTAGDKPVSQYSGLKPYWKTMGYSNGSVSLAPSDHNRRLIKDWMKVNDPWNYWKYNIALKPGKKGWTGFKDSKTRFIVTAFAKKNLDIDRDFITSDHRRGIYFCRFYENTDLYLQDKISKSELKPSGVDFSVEGITERWKKKYALKRFKSLEKNNRLRLDERLFYSDMLTLTWEETKLKYLGEVGR